PRQQPHLVTGAGAQPVVPAAGGVVADEVLPLGAVGGDGAGQAGEVGDGGRVLARGLEQVRDFEDVTGDLEVAVAVHGGRRFLGGKRREAAGRRVPRHARIAGGGEGRLGGNEETAAGSRGTRRRRERVGLNSRNSDSYSERGQHRGTRRSGSR